MWCRAVSPMLLSLSIAGASSSGRATRAVFADFRRGRTAERRCTIWPSSHICVATATPTQMNSRVTCSQFDTP